MTLLLVLQPQLLKLHLTVLVFPQSNVTLVKSGLQDRVVSVGSSVVDLTIRAPESKLKFEAYDTNGNYKTITHDILTDGTFTLNSDTFGSDYSIIQFTVFPELAIDRVRVDGIRRLEERTDPFIKVVRWKLKI